MDEARCLGEHLDELLDVAKELVSSEAKGTRSVKVRVHGDVRSRNEWQRMLHKVQSILPSMRYVGSNLRDLSMELTSKAPSLAALLEDGGKAFRANAEALEEVFLKPEDGKVYCLDAEDPEIEICGAPVYIGPLLKDRLFDRLDAVVLTSATLSVEGDFSFFTSRLGITNADELSVEAPFDYDRAVLIYVADDVPDPNSPGYQRAVEEHVARIVEAAEGRTLVLFTSNSALRATYRALEGRLARAKIVPLGQGFDGSRKSLLERFSALPRAVLFGSASFWEGIDVAGDALSVLIITRLPFEVPGDPVFSAKAEQFSEPFDEFAVPSAVL